MTKETMADNAPFRRILENLSTATLLFNRQLELLYMNPAGEMLFELSAKRSQGYTINKLFGHNPALIDSMRLAISDVHPFTEREIGLQLAADKKITVDCTVTPMSEDSSKPALLLVEVSPLDRQLRIAKEESLLAQHQTALDVVRGLAHEIKNPLGGIRGAAQLLERELENGLKEYTGIIIDEADRLKNLLNRMLGPNSLPQPKHINIHEVIERVRQLVQAEAPNTVTLVRDYDPSVPDLYADPDQLIQALLNLVRNAIQSVDEQGTVTLRTRTQRQVTIGSRRHKLVVAIEIIDNGPGIAAEMIDKIFFPMVTGRADGTGLGLPIAQTLINKHGGLIECHSRPGKTVFTLLIPLESNHEPTD